MGFCVGWPFGWDINKLEDQWATGDDARTTGQEVTANDVLEDRGFATGLGADYDLRG